MKGESRRLSLLDLISYYESGPVLKQRPPDVIRTSSHPEELVYNYADDDPDPGKTLTRREKTKEIHKKALGLMDFPGGSPPGAQGYRPRSSYEQQDFEASFVTGFGGPSVIDIEEDKPPSNITRLERTKPINIPFKTESENFFSFLETGKLKRRRIPKVGMNMNNDQIELTKLAKALYKSGYEKQANVITKMASGPKMAPAAIVETEIAPPVEPGVVHAALDALLKGFVSWVANDTDDDLYGSPMLMDLVSDDDYARKFTSKLKSAYKGVGYWDLGMKLFTNKAIKEGYLGIERGMCGGSYGCYEGGSSPFKEYIEGDGAALYTAFKKAHQTAAVANGASHWPGLGPEKEEQENIDFLTEFAESGRGDGSIPKGFQGMTISEFWARFGPRHKDSDVQGDIEGLFFCGPTQGQYCGLDAGEITDHGGGSFTFAGKTIMQQWKADTTEVDGSGIGFNPRYESLKKLILNPSSGPADWGAADPGKDPGKDPRAGGGTKRLAMCELTDQLICNKSQGDEFRTWVNANDDIKKRANAAISNAGLSGVLDPPNRTTKFDNSWMRKAWGAVGEDYKRFKGGGDDKWEDAIRGPQEVAQKDADQPEDPAAKEATNPIDNPEDWFGPADAQGGKSSLYMRRDDGSVWYTTGADGNTLRPLGKRPDDDNENVKGSDYLATAEQRRLLNKVEEIHTDKDTIKAYKNMIRGERKVQKARGRPNILHWAPGGKRRRGRKLKRESRETIRNLGNQEPEGE